MDVSGACERCGIEAPEEKFERRRDSMLCPYCASERSHPGLTILAVALLLSWPVLASVRAHGLAGLMDHVVGTGIFVVAIAVLVVVHEAGHALAAAALGGDVVAVQIGQGKPRLRFHLRSVRVTIHTFPFGGATMAAGLRGRWRHALFALAGVVTEAAFVVAMLALTIRTGSLSLLTSTMLIVAFVDIVVNLWPRSVKTPDGMIRTDGARLLDIARADSPEDAELSAQEHEWSLRFMLPSIDRDVDAMLALTEAELAERPDNPDARARRGVALLMAERFVEAYEQMAAIVDDDRIIASRRPFLWNNTAWGALMSMDGRLLPVADRLSMRAVAELPFQPEVVSTRGAVLAILGRRDEAERLLEWCEPKMQGDDVATCAAFRALAALDDGDVFEARRHFARVPPGATPDRLWRAVAGRLAPLERRRVVQLIASGDRFDTTDADLRAMVALAVEEVNGGLQRDRAPDDAIVGTSSGRAVSAAELRATAAHVLATA